MKSLTLRILCLCLMLTLLCACNIQPPGPRPSPTVEVQPIETRTATPAPAATSTATATSAASPTAAVIELATAAPSPSPKPENEAAPLSPTPEYLEYLVQEGETLFYIIQLPQHGYGYEPSVVAAVVALNDNLRNADDLRPGQTILIPRPTLSPTPVNAEATQAVLAAIGLDSSSGAALKAGSVVGCHQVIANDSMVGIALEYNTTLEILSDLNRNLSWQGCNFTLPSGGPGCGPALSIGLCVRVPLPSPVPTKIPTPSGDETATPTPTKMAPRLLYPAADAEAPPGALTVQWLGISGLGAGDVYLIELVNQTLQSEHRAVSRANAYRLPLALAPQAGQAEVWQWRVSVARQDSQGRYYLVGAPGNWRAFRWLGG